ncbi:hypothetical protein HDV57DRAFT_486577 [Trichoderma longibrachiatum]
MGVSLLAQPCLAVLLGIWPSTVSSIVRPAWRVWATCMQSPSKPRSSSPIFLHQSFFFRFIGGCAYCTYIRCNRSPPHARQLCSKAA